MSVGGAVMPSHVLCHRGNSETHSSEPHGLGVPVGTTASTITASSSPSSGIRNNDKSSKRRLREGGRNIRNICHIMHEFFTSERNTVCVLLTSVILLLGLSLCLLATCGWLLMDINKGVATRSTSVTAKTIDTDAITDLWRIFNTASRTNEGYHMRALRDHLLRYKQMAEERQRKEGGPTPMPDKDEPTHSPSVALLPRFTTPPGQTLPEVLSSLGGVIAGILERDPKDGLEKASVFLSKNFWPVEKMKEDSKLSPLSMEREAFEPFDDILYLQLRRFFDADEVEKKSPPHADSQSVHREEGSAEASTGTRAKKNADDEESGRQWWNHVRTRAPSVHTGRFYYPIRRFHRMRRYSAETTEVTAAWFNAMAYDYFEDNEGITPFVPPDPPTPEHISAMTDAIKGMPRVTSSSGQSVYTGTLFVNVASFRDRECWPSTNHMLQQVGNAFRVYIGIAEQHRMTDPTCLSYDVLLPRLCMADPSPPSARNTMSDGDGNANIRGRGRRRVIRSATLDNNKGGSLDNKNRFGGAICFPMDNIRLRHVDSSTAYGPTLGRYMGMLLYQGEDYALVLDSHNRFVYAWDMSITAMYVAQRHPRLVLSHYPESYPDKEEEEEDSFVYKSNSSSYLCQAKFLEEYGYVRLVGVIADYTAQVKRNSRFLKPYIIPELHLDQSITRPFPQPWVAGGFLFANASIMREVPFDPHLPYIFDGEEVMYSVRLWTHGYDIHSPIRGICFHIYTRKNAPKFWLEAKNWGAVQVESRKRIQCFLQARVRGVDVLRVPRSTRLPVVVLDADRYGIGRVRSVEEWYAFAGLDPVQYTLDGRWCGL